MGKAAEMPATGKSGKSSFRLPQIAMTGIADGVRLATPTGALPDKDWLSIRPSPTITKSADFTRWSKSTQSSTKSIPDLLKTLFLCHFDTKIKSNRKKKTVYIQLKQEISFQREVET